jgi:hypothetical protein
VLAVAVVGKLVRKSALGADADADGPSDEARTGISGAVSGIGDQEWQRASSL